MSAGVKYLIGKLTAGHGNNELGIYITLYNNPLVVQLLVPTTGMQYFNICTSISNFIITKTVELFFEST